MTWELAREIILDALKDSGLIFAFVFLVHLILALFEEKLAGVLTRNKKTGTLFGSLFGLIPQCGTSVLGADLYLKKYITIGTLAAIFLSCSDEAFIVMLTRMNEKTIMILPLIGLKFAIGFVTGIIFDWIYYRKKDNELDEYHEDHLCHQHHEENTKLHRYLIHPLIHSLQIFAYVLVINLALGFIIGFVGESNFEAFLITNKYLAPLFSGIIGLIPNCASSLLLTELFMKNSLSFGALLAGLLVNSGLGMMMLLKSGKNYKTIFLLVSVCFIVAIASGYIACLIAGF